MNKDLTINGHGHTIDCLGKEGCSAFYSNTGNIVLKNLIIINGHNDYTNKGGAIFIEGTAKYTLINCSLIDNCADDFAGAIYNDGGHTLTLKNCLFRGNTADDDDGGAIFTNEAIDAENTIFEDNKADDYAGAVYINCNKYSQFKNCVFKYNVAGDDIGGAITCDNINFYHPSIAFWESTTDRDGGMYSCPVYIGDIKYDGEFEVNASHANCYF